LHLAGIYRYGDGYRQHGEISDVILEYGGNIGAPFYLVAIMGILSIWLFSGSVAILVYIARNSRDIAAAMKNMLPGAETKAATEE
jgi:hypothetical protein